MAETITLGLLSDIHYASAAEKARGSDYELRGLTSPWIRLWLRAYRHWLWLRNPLERNYLLDRFLAHAEDFDFVIANGDYSCNSGFVGVSDEAACQSVSECLEKLRQRFGPNFRANYGDHELGKVTFGHRGGMRLASWRRAREQLQLPPFWQVTFGHYVVMGVVSSLVALPVMEADTLPEERSEWEQLRAEHLGEIRAAFTALQPTQRVVLFCHDPTALPFLWREETVRARLGQVELTIIGHLHSHLIWWKSRLLAGMPTLGFLGHTAKKMSRALNEARLWRPFHVRLCPSLAGIEAWKDGGYCTLELDPGASRPARFRHHRLPRTEPADSAAGRVG
jgi:hypothetical protein